MPINRDLLNQYMADKLHTGEHIGLSLAVIENHDTEFLNYGVTTYGGRAPMSQNAFYEMASVGKVFTSLLVLRLMQEGNLSLDLPVQEVIPEISRDHRLSVKDLLSHTSGLSNHPMNFVLRAPENSYISYDEKMLLEALAILPPLRERGRFSYSSFGYLILGLLVRRIRKDASFEALLQDKVLNPLGTDDIVFQLNPAQQGRICVGHSPEKVPVAPYGDLGEVYLAAGALKGTVAGMAEFVKVMLGCRSADSTLRQTMERSLSVEADTEGALISPTCHVRQINGHRTYYHSGSLAGNKSTVLIAPDLNRGLVYFSNTLQHVQPIWDVFLA
ncbi:MAG: serine hydrolase domain-containing protein [Oligoflexales bacterium]